MPSLLLNHEVVAVVRRAGTAPEGAQEVVVGDISKENEWTQRLRHIEAVVHLAARVHVLDEGEADPLAAYRAVNTQSTLNLARAAASVGVSRFVFLSSIAVHGTVGPGALVGRDTSTAPQNAYGVSKLEAEEALALLAARSSMQVVTLRPPVVYGPTAGGNVQRIARAVQRGIPLPLSAIKNQRTMLAIENLVRAIEASLIVESVPAVPVVLGDTSPVSTPELARLLGEGLGRPARLVRVPVRFLRAVGTLLNRRDDIDRLTQDLVINPDWGVLGVDPDLLTSPREGLVALGRYLGKEEEAK